ncbi:OLC1v1007545C1 [Oldenlandia corymbosa var. corymbosa]|uniref:OLC1v1007545C1 n=1 Tax=Oldenlandia corymbosa var. corymbosa TaxID=529605 RepID=A0AAV1DJQ6_OLDCO|nr:OLC1v1007545C1 [Oldenlandia corymbosa var. corymbosa]
MAAGFAKMYAELPVLMKEVDKFDAIDAKLSNLMLEVPDNRGSTSCVGKKLNSPAVASISSVKIGNQSKLKARIEIDDDKKEYVDEKVYQKNWKPKPKIELAAMSQEHTMSLAPKLKLTVSAVNRMLGGKVPAQGVSKDDDNVDLEDVKWISDELENLGKAVELSAVDCWTDCLALDSKEEDEPRKLIIIIGYVNGEMVRILVDTGAARSSINEQLALRLGLTRQVVKPYFVKVADGHKIRNNVICPAAK